MTGILLGSLLLYGLDFLYVLQKNIKSLWQKSIRHSQSKKKKSKSFGLYLVNKLNYETHVGLSLKIVVSSGNFTHPSAQWPLKIYPTKSILFSYLPLLYIRFVWHGFCVWLPLKSPITNLAEDSH